MMLGADITHIADWEVRLRRTPAVASVAFGPGERRHAAGDPARLALCWALKESVAKALGTGFAGVGWRAIEVLDIDAVAVTLRAPLPRATHRAWRADIITTRDRVVAAVAVSPGRARFASCHVTVPRDARSTRERGEQLSLAARRAACSATYELLPGEPALTWARTSRGAPVLGCGLQGLWLRVSLAHDGGEAIALVGMSRNPVDCQEAEGRTLERTEIELVFDRELLRGVRDGIPRCDAAHVAAPITTRR